MVRCAAPDRLRGTYKWPRAREPTARLQGSSPPLDVAPAEARHLPLPCPSPGGPGQRGRPQWRHGATRRRACVAPPPQTPAGRRKSRAPHRRSLAPVAGSPLCPALAAHDLSHHAWRPSGRGGARRCGGQPVPPLRCLGAAGPQLARRRKGGRRRQRQGRRSHGGLLPRYWRRQIRWRPRHQRRRCWRWRQRPRQGPSRRLNMRRLRSIPMLRPHFRVLSLRRTQGRWRSSARAAGQRRQNRWKPHQGPQPRDLPRPPRGGRLQAAAGRPRRPARSGGGQAPARRRPLPDRQSPRCQRGGQSRRRIPCPSRWPRSKCQW